MLPVTISLDDVKQYLRVDHSDDDVLIDSMLMAAQEYVENFTKRTYENDSYGLVVPATVRMAILLLVAHWYDNRSVQAIGTVVSAELQYSIKNLLWQNRVNL